MFCLHVQPSCLIITWNWHVIFKIWSDNFWWPTIIPSTGQWTSNFVVVWAIHYFCKCTYCYISSFHSIIIISPKIKNIHSPSRQASRAVDKKYKDKNDKGKITSAITKLREFCSASWGMRKPVNFKLTVELKNHWSLKNYILTEKSRTIYHFVPKKSLKMTRFRQGFL